MHISIIEDEVQLWKKMSDKLSNNGYIVSNYTSYSEFMELWNDKSNMYIIDIGLWDWSGFDIINWLRKNKYSKAPILITSWYGDTEKIVYWLNIWADDYMIKPCAPDEFMARISALARRNIEIKNTHHTPEPILSFKYKDIVYYPDTKKLFLAGKEVWLSRREACIIELFIRNPKSIINRETIVEHGWYWQQSCNINDQSLNTTLSRIRKKLGNSFNMRSLYNFWYILD